MYGTVRTVVWEGRPGNGAPYPIAALTNARGGLPDGVTVDRHEDEVFVHVDGGARSYRVRGLQQNKGNQALRVTLRALLPVETGGQQYDDQLDLYNGRQRSSFVKAAAEALGRSPAILQTDFGHVLNVCENWQLDRLKEQARRSAGGGLAAGPADRMSEQERGEALALLRDPQLLRRIVDDLATCGLVGETVNKLGCYLAATSRLLPRPLAVLVQSSSAAGKTTLMDAVLALMPEESRKRASAISEMALYYDQDGLQHKILAIAEEEGAQSASYSLKLLQSDGSLTFARPVKNPDTGELVTRTHQVDGPVQLMLTTTKTLLDDELANRCLVLTVSEDAEQTESIHERQREAFDFGGIKARVQRDKIRTVHQNAQRLLQPLQVINPFSKQLRFTAARVRARRDHQKYVDLIASVTFFASVPT